jgi:hypothetical protein
VISERQYLRPHEWSAPLGGPSGAHVSECGRYRTLLWRTFAVGGDAAPLVFVMLNPSTADATKDDPTIRRCLGFARREGMGGIIVVNLLPWRATDPRDLDSAYWRDEDVFLVDENRKEMGLARSFGPFVLAWGGSIKPWADGAARMARQIAGHGLCLGRTKSGEPRHPLMLPKTARLENFV